MRCGSLLGKTVVIGAMAFAAQAAEPDIRRVPFTAEVTVGVDGKPSIGEISGAKLLASVIRDQLSKMPYVPAQSAEGPAASSEQVQGMVILTPAGGGNYEARLDEVVVGPVPIKRVPMQYPTSQARAGRSGYAEIMLTISPDGGVEKSEIVSASHKDFAKASTEALRKWRFKTGASTSIESPVSVVFHTEGKALPEVTFECRLAQGRPHIRGQSGCADRIIVTGEVM